jgi:hypothetical protein
MSSISSAFIDWVSRIIAVVILVVVIPALYSGYALNEVKTDIVEMQVLVSGVFASPDCLAYKDSLTGRVYPGVVDFSKFEHCSFNIFTKRTDIAMKVVVKGEGFSSAKYFVPGTESTEQDFKEKEALFGMRTSTLKDYPLSKEVVVLKDGAEVNGRVDFFVMEMK